MPLMPVDDPSRGESLADRSVQYVRSSRLLRACLVLTVADHVAAMLLVALGKIAVSLAGFVALMSVLSWFFAVCIPVMNRSLRGKVGAPSTGGVEALELLFRMVLAVQTLLYTLFLIQFVLQAE